MNRCTVIDRLEDEYGIKPENLTEREKAIIGLCTNEFLENEEQALSIANVVGRSGQLKAEVFTLANKLAVAGEGDAAVAMHRIHNRL